MNIAHLSFGYDNAALLSLLIERGTHLTKGNYKKVTEVDNKIAELLNEKEEQLKRPVNCFITFETQQGLDRALGWFPGKFSGNESKLKELLGEQ